MAPSEIKDGSGWCVLVSWPSGLEQHVPGFRSLAEAEQWIVSGQNLKRGLEGILGPNMRNTLKRRRDLNVRATLPSVNLRSAGFALQRDS